MDFDAGMHHRRELSPGQMLGHYRIESWLGEGAMGVVYRAVDTHLDRPVAVKVLRPESVAHPERRRRFIQEAKAASALNHPNIITIYDISSADGVDYIAMEYVDGKTLGALIGRRGLPWSEAVKYGMQVADALAAAHAAGLVHRDLKPANVMATPQGLVKVLDFGLAKLIEATEAVSHTARDEDEHTPTETVRVAPAPHTEDGVIVGTVAYMSPEQAQGRPLDGRSDIFAFGSLFYEMLTGRWAFNGDNRLAILAAILNQEPAALGVEVPPELERVLHRCLRKDPERRFQAMGDVRVALQELKEESESGRLAQAPASAWVPTRRRLWTAAALAAVVLAAAGSWWLRERARDKPPAGEKLIAVLPFRNVGGDPAHQAFCDGLSETVTSRLTQLERFQNALRVVSSSEVRREKVASARDARQALGAALVVDGSLHRSGEGAVVTASLVDTRRGVQLRSQSIRVRVEELPRLQDLLIEAITGMLEREAGFHAKLPSGVPGATSAPGAYDYYVQGRGYLQDPDRAPNVESALALFRRALEIDPGYALALAGLGEAYWHKYRVTNDPRWINEAVQACAAAIRLNEELAPTHVTLGVVYRGTGRHEEAIGELQRALQLDPLNPDAHRELASVYMAMGKVSEAEGTYRRAIELRPGYWAGYSDLAVFYFRRGRYPEAEAMLREVVRLTPDNAKAYSNLGGVYHMMGRYEEATAALNRSLAIKPTASAYSNLGTIYAFQGHYPEAVAPMEKAIALGVRDYQIQGNLAECYLRTPALAGKAPAAYREAVRLAEEVLVVNPKNARARATLGSYRVRLGDKTRALADIAEALRQAPDDGHVLFRGALVHELAGDRERALALLEAALRNGYSREEIRRGADLAELRKDPRYSRLPLNER